MRYLRPDAVLAVEPGGQQVEHGRHRQFAAHNVWHRDGVEWFTPHDDLIAHIAQVAAIYDAPPMPRFGAPRGPRSTTVRRTTRFGDDAVQAVLARIAEEGITGDDLMFLMQYHRGTIPIESLPPEKLVRLGWLGRRHKLLTSLGVVLCLSKGMTIAEIGRHLDIHESTVSRLSNLVTLRNPTRFPGRKATPRDEEKP